MHQPVSYEVLIPEDILVFGLAVHIDCRFGCTDLINERELDYWLGVFDPHVVRSACPEKAGGHDKAFRRDG